MYPHTEADQLRADLTDLRSQLAATEAARTTWQQRATSAEAERDRLRGELAALREAIKLGLDHYHHAMEGMGDDVLESALLATPRAAQLGTLVEAALAETLIEDEMTNLGPFEDGTKAFQNRLAACKTTRRLAARAVLASEVRT